MKKKLNCVLLVDDDTSVNFINEKVIRSTHRCSHIIVKDSAEKALNYISGTQAESLQPDLILLDINMPGMSGWDFLEAYQHLTKIKSDMIIIMLTTSINPDDKAKARMLTSVADFRNKPLTVAVFLEIVNYFFED
jgi:response regulator of citrate/malate metabolism